LTREQIRLNYANATTELLPLLRERAFHVTCQRNLDAILRAGAIAVNADGTLETTFGSSSNSFFRNRGCVSIFDYRNISDKDLDDSIFRCSPWQPAERCDWHLAFLFLTEEARRQLRPWTEWKTTQSLREMVVPYAEAGFPGAVPISAISDILEVSFEYTPHPFIEALRRRPAPRL
jgi:hypothetical protein